MVATFRERVRVYRRRTPEDFDVLACDRLRLFLERAEVGEAESTSSQSADVANADSNSTSLQPGRGVRFLWMSAVGDKVILHSVEKELTAVMKRLDHDPERQRTWLNDLRFDPRYQQADGEQLLQHPRVRVRRGTSEIECLQAELRHADERRLARPPGAA